MVEIFENERFITDIKNSEEFVKSVLNHLQNLEDRIISYGSFKLENDLGGNSWLYSFDPSDWNFEIAKMQECDISKLKGAIKNLKVARIDINLLEERTNKLINLFQTHRARLVALLMLEVGKPILEADAEVAEAIDFCRYYLMLLRSLQPRKLSKNHEHTWLLYEARGVTCVISPWNFPIAIPTGMIISNLLVGNPVVFKPAEQSIFLGYELFKLIREAGWGETDIILAPGYGESVGEFLVKSSQIETIMFTGSKAVGARIIELSSKHHSNLGFKRVIAEMGGKNAIYVHEDADIEFALNITVASAFGYAGQKCSACSRLFVHKNISPEFLPKLAEAVRSIRVGSAKDPETVLPYVINRDAYHRLWNVIQQASKEGLVIARSGYPDSNSASFIPATLLYQPAFSSIYATEELFGPILCYFEVENFDEALERINGVDYALTGGVITKSRDIIQKAVKEFNCGNLYVNRKITGALVGKHPFGGRRFSGTGFKAGGPNYLLQLVNEKAVSITDIELDF